MHPVENYTLHYCHQNVNEFVRMFGLVYLSLLLTLGTIGNVLSLLVIRSVEQREDHQPSHPHFTQREASEIAPYTSSPDNSPASPTVASVSLVFPSIRESKPNVPAVPKRRPIRKHPSKSIFTALSIADTVALWVNPFRYFLKFAFYYDLRTQGGVFMCRCQTFLAYATKDAAVCVLCLLTLERYLIGCYPHKAKIIWRGRRKVVTWIMAFLLILAKNLVLLFILKLIYQDDEGNFTVVDPDPATFNTTARLVICDTLDLTPRRIFFYLDIVTYSLLPSFLLLVLNIPLYRVIKRRNKRYGFYSHPVDTIVSKHDGSLRIKRSVIQANRLLIPVSVFHLITSVPICIFSIIEDAMQLKLSHSPDTRCIVNTCGYLFVMLGASTYGVNCLIYFLSSSQFRERLYALTKVHNLTKKNAPLRTSCDPLETESKVPKIAPDNASSK